MSAGSHIRAVGQDGGETTEHTGVEPVYEGEQTTYEEPEWLDEPLGSTSRGWLAPAIASAVILAWTVLFVASNWMSIADGIGVSEAAELLTNWCIPVLLVIACWLLAMRSSTREATRFGDAASVLSAEAQRLEERLIVINRELSVAREFLAAESRELDSLGRIASERISEHAEALQGLIHHNGAQVDAIATVSASAMENMGRLRNDLPVIANSARDVSNQIGNAGRTASDQLNQMIAGFERLNEFGAASERQVSTLRSRVDQAIAAFEAQANQLDSFMNRRFADLAEKSEAHRADLDSHEVDALAAMRHRADRLRAEIAQAGEALEEHEAEALVSLQARINSIRESAGTVNRSLGETETRAVASWNERIEAVQSRLSDLAEKIGAFDDVTRAKAAELLLEITGHADELNGNLTASHGAFVDLIKARRDALAEQEADAAEALAASLAAFDTELAERRQDQIAQTHMLAENAEALASRIDALEVSLTRIGEHGQHTRERVGQSVAELTGTLEASRSALNGTDQMVAQLTESSVRLLELLQAASEQGRDDLPASLSEVETRLQKVLGESRSLKDTLETAGVSVELTAGQLGETEQSGKRAIAEIRTLQDDVKARQEHNLHLIGELQGKLADLDRQGDALAEKTRGELREAILAVESASRDALAKLEIRNAEQVNSFAQRVADDAARIIDSALSGHATDSISALEQAASQAAATGREAAIQMRDQLSKVNELAANLESRVNRARELAEEQVDNDFSRRVALITESLNSNAIDIAKALSTEVTDTAWNSYLRGDRGIFTRRAVRLLDNGQSREVAEIYEEDPDFREHVSRYIHDFEAMLRTMLSTRDGHALGVTLLSSDMGKLYVALAQSIERLRN